MATVKFISYVEQNEDGSWYIKLEDTFDKKVVVCKDLNEYKEQIEDMGSEYGNDIEVQWVRSKDLSPANIQELQEQMAKLQKEYEDEIKQLENDEAGFNQNNQGGFSSNE
jgi:Tfp pilus assembly protein PilO